MCNTLAQAGADILAMPYFKNENARSGDFVPGHEEAVALVLERHGFVRYTQKDVPQLQKKHLKNWWNNGFGDQLDELLEDLPPGSFVLQPGGSQSFPDILVKDFNGRLIALECKSGKGTHPMWNDSTPKPGAAYIMSSANTNSTTMFMGEDVITPEEQAVIDRYHVLFEELKQQCKQEMATVSTHNRGWLYSHRRQFFQQGGATLTNYFTHADRTQCEQNVLEFLRR